MAPPKTAHICINLTPDLAHLELLQYDAAKGVFVKTDSEELLLDPSTREILEEEGRLKAIIKRLYERNKIPTTSYTALVVPSFFTREYQLPDGVPADDLKTLLTSEAETFYVFKRIDPEVGFAALSNGKILFTAYPKSSLDNFKAAFAELKIPLVSIDCNYTACLRGIVSMGIVQQEITTHTRWGLLIVSDYTLFMAVMEGANIDRVSEFPLSIQNADELSLLGDIGQDFRQFFGYEVLSRLIVVNNSLKLVSGQVIDASQFQGPTDVFDQNHRTLASLNAEDAPFPCSLEAVGGSLVPIVPIVPALDMADPDILKNKADEAISNLIAYSLLGLAGVVFVAQLGFGFLMDSLDGGEKQKTAALQGEINQAMASMTVLPQIKRKLLAKQVLFENSRLNNLVIKLGQTLPPDAWLKIVSAKSSEDLKTLDVNIDGGALTAEPLSQYVQELNRDFEKNPLVPTITPQQKDSQRYFSFTLTNKPANSAAAGAPAR
jgi:hypothetical protein